MEKPGFVSRQCFLRRSTRDKKVPDEGFGDLFVTITRDTTSDLSFGIIHDYMLRDH